jgi:hypothetical protein
MGDACKVTVFHLPRQPRTLKLQLSGGTPRVGRFRTVRRSTGLPGAAMMAKLSPAADKNEHSKVGVRGGRKRRSKPAQHTGDPLAKGGHSRHEKQRRNNKIRAHILWDAL